MWVTAGMTFQKRSITGTRFFARSILDISVCPSPALRWCCGSADGRLSQPVATVPGLRTSHGGLGFVLLPSKEKHFLMSDFCSFLFSSTHRTEQFKMSAGLGHVNEGFRPEYDQKCTGVCSRTSAHWQERRSLWLVSEAPAD